MKRAILGLVLLSSGTVPTVSGTTEKEAAQQFVEIFRRDIIMLYKAVSEYNSSHLFIGGPSSVVASGIQLSAFLKLRRPAH